jgi:hypothetical protein
MVQLRFAVFAIIVLAFWIGHLFVISPSLSARAVDAASAHAISAPASVEARIEEQRRELQRIAARASGTGAVAALVAAKAKGEAPSVEKFLPFRDAFVGAVPESLRDSVVLGLVNEVGSIHSSGRGKPVTGKSDLDFTSLITSAGAEGIWQEALGATQVFFSFSLASPDRAETKPLGFVVVGFPVATPRVLEDAAKRGGLDAIALLRAGKVVSISGPEKLKPEEIDRNITPGKTAVARRGSLSSLGPFKFPIFTNGDVFGGRAPLWIASRQAVVSTPYEVLGLVTLRPFMQSLANYQRLAFLGFIIILGLSLVVVALVGSRGALFDSNDEPRAVLSAAFLRTGVFPSRQTESIESILQSSLRQESSPSVPPAPIWARADESAAPSGSFGPPPPRVEAFNGGPTAFASDGAEALQPDATRVATIPEELLRASAFPAEEELPPPRSLPEPASLISHPVDPEEEHFQQVFETFVATRTQCGEPTEGITYEKFATKLRNNRDQLIQKYNWRTVRFHVYVKDGKAALRATPVRD